MTTIRTHTERDLRPLTVLVALVAAVVAIVVAVMMIGGDDPTAPAVGGSQGEVNLGSEHRGLMGTNAVRADGRTLE